MLPKFPSLPACSSVHSLSLSMEIIVIRFLGSFLKFLYPRKYRYNSYFLYFYTKGGALFILF